MQAIILAAGMGKRLKELTNDRTKCMVNVNGIPLIERMLSQLDDKDFSRIVIVIGYQGQNLKEFVLSLRLKTEIIFIENEDYDKTNNIYSLFLAKEYLITEDTLLFESDLIFEEAVITKLLDNDYSNLAMVAKYESWMDGTVLTIDSENNIKSFLGKNDFDFSNIKNYYKTVNIYKFSKEFSTTHYVPFLEAYSQALGNNEYYEQVLKVISLLEEPKIKALPIENEKWYEIDDIQDLDIAETIFTDSESEKLQKFQNRYGGYWRYPKLLDYCYLVNPYYPSSKLISELKANFDILIREYPSGLSINNLLISKNFGLNKEYVCVGNGAAEIIKSLIGQAKNKIGVIAPTFEEYPNRSKQEIISFVPKNNNFSYSTKDIIEFFEDKSIGSLILINPDNPSGNYIKKDEVISLVNWANKRNIDIILDESFIDFIDHEEQGSLLNNDLLEKFKNLIVIKSISKSYGVPGLRLGFIASANLELIEFIRKDLAIWNINSFAEFYLQIFEKYQAEYWEAIDKFKIARDDFYKKLENIAFIRTVPSQANYILCELDSSTTKLAQILLNRYNILIKDLSPKKGFEGKKYIRINIKTVEENNMFIKALSDIQSKELLN